MLPPSALCVSPGPSSRPGSLAHYCKLFLMPCCLSHNYQQIHSDTTHGSVRLPLLPRALGVSSKLLPSPSYEGESCLAGLKRSESHQPCCLASTCSEHPSSGQSMHQSPRRGRACLIPGGMALRPASRRSGGGLRPFLAAYFCHSRVIFHLDLFGE